MKKIKSLTILVVLLQLVAIVTVAHAESGSGSDYQPDPSEKFTVNGEPWCYPAGRPIIDGSVGGTSTATYAYGNLNHRGFDVCSWTCGDDLINYVHYQQIGWVGYGHPGGDGLWSFSGESKPTNTGIQTCPFWSDN